MGIVKVELNPNLTTNVTANTSGVEACVGGSGVSVTTEHVEVHTPAGSVRVKCSEAPERTEKYVDWWLDNDTFY